MLPTECKGYDLEADGLLMVGTRDDEDIVVLLESQSVNDKEMFKGLFASGLYALLPVGNLLASLVLGKEDLEWLKRRYKQMTDILKDASAYRWMTEDAREAGIEQGIERGREQERQAAQEAMLEQLRKMTMEIVIGRFPKFVRLAKKQVRDAKDPGRLQRTLVKISLAHDNDDIEPYL